MSISLKNLRNMTEKLIESECPTAATNKLKKLSKKIENMINLIDKGSYDQVRQTLVEIKKDICDNEIKQGNGDTDV